MGPLGGEREGGARGDGRGRSLRGGGGGHGCESCGFGRVGFKTGWPAVRFDQNRGRRCEYLCVGRRGRLAAQEGRLSMGAL